MADGMADGVEDMEQNWDILGHKPSMRVPRHVSVFMLFKEEVG